MKFATLRQGETYHLVDDDSREPKKHYHMGTAYCKKWVSSNTDKQAHPP